MFKIGKLLRDKPPKGKARVEEAKASESIGQSVLGIGREMLEKIKEIGVHTYENLNSN